MSDDAAVRDTVNDRRRGVDGVKQVSILKHEARRRGGR
jgi:hypothetical protein